MDILLEAAFSTLHLSLYKKCLPHGRLLFTITSYVIHKLNETTMNTIEYHPDSSGANGFFPNFQLLKEENHSYAQNIVSKFMYHLRENGAN